MPSRTIRSGPFLALAWTLALLPGAADAGGPYARRARGATPTASTYEVARPPANAPTPMLGTFYPTPYIQIGGGGTTTGGGYSPLGQYGNTTLSYWGPISPYRSVAAPVLTYTRGYDGITRPTVATSFSNPFQPDINPVVYPTQANVYTGFPGWRTPPWWQRGHGFVDQD